MQSRRWWLLVVAALLSAGISSTYAATATPIATATSPDKGVSAADGIVKRILNGGTDAQKASDDLEVIAVANSADATWLDTFMRETVAKRFEERIFNPSQGVPQNIQTVAIVALVRTQKVVNIATFDPLFTKQLSNQYAAVRYWAAKGIGNMIDAKLMNNLGDAAKKSIYTALGTAGMAETSSLAQAQMVRALAGFGEYAVANSILDKNAGRFRFESLSSTDADALAAELTALSDAMKISLPKGKDLTDTVKNASWLASFAAQQAANAAVNKTSDANKVFEGAKDVVNASISVLNSATKAGTFPPSGAKDALVLYDEVDTLTKKTIQAQSGFNTIPVPPEVKLGGGPASSTPTPTPAPATSTAPAATSTRPK